MAMRMKPQSMLKLAIHALEVYRREHYAQDHFLYSAGLQKGWPPRVMKHFEAGYKAWERCELTIIHLHKLVELKKVKNG